MTGKLKVFTNGCFDILHVGHIALLEYAGQHGEVTVGLNSDSSIRRLKGNQRPINCEENRKKVIEALKYVHNVIIFEEDTPYELIKSLKPDLIIKGGDYKPSDVVGADLAKVIIFPLVDGNSTTTIISKLAKLL